MAGPGRSAILLGVLGVVAFICFWMFLPFVIGGIFIIAGITLYTKYKPQKYVLSEGKSVLITGCDTGFGNTLAQRLDEKGYQVFAGCLFPDQNGAQELKNKCSNKLYIVPLDVTSESQVSSAVNYVKSALGDGSGLWAVVNNAGIAVFCEAEWVPASMYEKILAVNVTGVVRVTMAFLPLVRKATGRIVNVASLAGRSGIPGFGPYSASKFGCIGFSDVLRREMKKFGIKVITVEPALYKTPIADEQNNVKNIEKYWASTSEEVKADYGEEYKAKFASSMLKFTKRASGKVYEVIDCIDDAVTALDPPSRYVPNIIVAMMNCLFGLLPDWIMDFVTSQMYKV